MDGLWIIIIALVGATISMSKKGQNKPFSEPGELDEHEPSSEDIKRQLREILRKDAVYELPADKPSTTQVKPATTIAPSQGSKAKYTTTSKSSTTTQTTGLNHIETQKNKPSNQPIQVENTDKQGSSEIDRIIGEFDMEKAVIYSEILRPKYEEY